MVENYTRSQRGYRLIRQRMSDLYDLDLVAFPTRPMFDVDTGMCRLKPFVLSVPFLSLLEQFWYVLIYFLYTNFMLYHPVSLKISEV